MSKPIERLPAYFPTSCSQCKAPTEKFFACFEEHAVMRDERDTASARQALHHCQPELLEYMTCMENYLKNKDKPRWKFW
ncbi:hypothetical protein STCU_00566 [Strigomonas culicis]|nr:hypothetical protein STCU_00566 [Strigomonas culicis]|eukprot:EPY36468.1 hypothetical protein STCU_00566 [Strigomonas culicis]